MHCTTVYRNNIQMWKFLFLEKAHEKFAYIKKRVGKLFLVTQPVSTAGQLSWKNEILPKLVELQRFHVRWPSHVTRSTALTAVYLLHDKSWVCARHNPVVHGLSTWNHLIIALGGNAVHWDERLGFADSD